MHSGLEEHSGETGLCDEAQKKGSRKAEGLLGNNIRRAHTPP